jgi:acetyltransferase
MSRKTHTLSEHASKALLADFGVPLARESVAITPAEAAAAAEEIGFPVVLKLCGDAIAHKTERGLVRLGLGDAVAVRAAAAALLALARPEDGPVSLLVAEQVAGRRELIAGLVRDPQFGPCVLLGLGGILTEALGDVAFAAAPLSFAEARALVKRLRASHLVTAAFRGEPAGDVEALADVLVALGRVGVERPEVASVDLNPVLLRARDGKPVAVDALVELGEPAAARVPRPQRAPAEILERLRPLFQPRGVLVAGVSAHPGKFGFVAYHNLMRFGFQGEVWALNRDGSEVLGRKTIRDVSELPEGAADLVFVCTPQAANLDLLRACAARGIRAAFVASGGYGEAGEEGRRHERELVALAEQLGMVVAGPNGQGVISTARSMCAQIVAPYPPPGRISVASQSGNLVSSFLNYAVLTGIGVSKAISAGNSAQLGLADYLDYFAADPETAVALCYLEGVPDGRRFAEAARALAAKKPLVLLKGGVAAEGKRAAASHTGSLASDDRIFDGVAAQVGALRAPTVEHAFEWAATFATQPLPRGRRTVVFTTAGGWGVLAADACAAAGLTLVPLPDDLREAIDALVPPRWSRSNPIDLAGGETRDTIPEVLDLVCAHPEVDAVIHLGLGIQAAQAQAFRSGPFFPGYGIDRIVEFHERQDRRYAKAAREASERHGKPVLSATEQTYTDRFYGNAGPVGVREEGRLCYPSAHRAVAALAALVRYADLLRESGDVGPNVQTSGKTW